RLHFAEPLYPRAGRRVFDVFAEGRRVLDHFDVASAAGGPRTAVVRESAVAVSDRRLDLSFLAWRDNAILPAIELRPAVQSPAAAGGSRTFGVSAAGVRVPDDHDIVQDAGAARRLTAQSFDVTVADGSLDLSFRGVAGDALVSYVAAFPTAAPAAELPYSLDAASDGERLVAAGQNLANVGYALTLYMDENKGKLPPDLKTLPGLEVDDARFFVDPRAGTHLPRGETSDAEDRAWIAAHDDFIYLGAGKSYRDLGDAIPLAYENPRRVPGPIHVLFGNGQVRRLERSAAAALIGFDPAPPAVTPTFPDPSSPSARKDPAIVQSAANLRTIGRAMFRFPNYYRGTFPATSAGSTRRSWSL